MIKRMLIFVFLLVAAQSTLRLATNFIQQTIKGVSNIAAGIFGLGSKNGVPAKVKTWNCKTGPIPGNGRVSYLGNGSIVVGSTKLNVAPCSKITFSPGRNTISVGEWVQYYAFNDGQNNWIQEITANTLENVTPAPSINYPVSGQTSTNQATKGGLVYDSNGKVYAPAGLRYVPNAEGGVLVPDPPGI